MRSAWQLEPSPQQETEVSIIRIQDFVVLPPPTIHEIFWRGEDCGTHNFHVTYKVFGKRFSAMKVCDYTVVHM